MSRRREIRSERAQQLQGLRAGFLSRAVASGTDVVIVLSLYVIGFLGANIAWDLFFSRSVSVSAPPHWLNELMVWILLVVYLTAGWGSAGRTLGKQMMGLRVLRSDGSPLRFRRSFLRAVLCVTFFPVLLLAVVDRRNRGLEDVAFDTVVVYDWLPEVSEPLRGAHLDTQGSNTSPMGSMSDRAAAFAGPAAVRPAMPEPGAREADRAQVPGLGRGR